MFNNDLLIDQTTGELDWPYIQRVAVARADQDFGPGSAPRYVRAELTTLKDRAMVVRAKWRQERGLPDDTVYVMSEPLFHGAAGDSFAA